MSDIQQFIKPRDWCEQCDFIGPELPTMFAAAREFHRAAHDVGRALLDLVERALRWRRRPTEDVPGCVCEEVHVGFPCSSGGTSGVDGANADEVADELGIELPPREDDDE